MGSRSPERVSVVGTSGSGKTTLGRRVAAALGCPFLELDSLNNLAGWEQPTREAFRARVGEFVRQERWVVDGNYRTKVQDLVWERADTVIWLDYPLIVPLWRVTWRSLCRGLRREELWNGNRENLWTHLFTRQSMILSTLHTHGRRFRYEPLLTDPGLASKRVLRFRRPSEAERWIRGLEASLRPPDSSERVDFVG